MTLIKTSLLNAIAVVIKMLTLLGINKVLAIYVGPSGYAAIGQFQNAVQMITTCASGAINTGVTKYTAEYNDNREKQHALWRTAGTIAFIGSVITTILIIIFSRQLAAIFLKDENYSGVFVWFGLTLTFFIFNTLLLSILNGKKEIQKYVVANISGSIFSIFITSILTLNYGLYGALVSLAVYQSLSFFVTLIICYRSDWFDIKLMFGRIDKITAINLSKYTLMALTSAACIPVSHIFIRSHIGDSFGWDVAGFWEAMWRLSTAYLMLVTTTLSVYYLPRFSELKDISKIKQEVYSGYKLILPLVIVCGLVIYVFRDFIIDLLFTPTFRPMRDLVAWQMLGDTLKIGSWLIGFLFISQARFKLFMFIEVYFSLQFYFFIVYFGSTFGIEGLSIAHAVNYFVCFAFVLIVFFFGKQTHD